MRVLDHFEHKSGKLACCLVRLDYSILSVLPACLGGGLRTCGVLCLCLVTIKV